MRVGITAGENYPYGVGAEDKGKGVGYKRLKEGYNKDFVHLVKINIG
jgi:hypothetical protein